MKEIKPDIRGLTPEEIKSIIKDGGEKSFRAEQVFHWVQARAACAWSEMTNIGPAVRNCSPIKHPFRRCYCHASGSMRRHPKYLWCCRTET